MPSSSTEPRDRRVWQIPDPDDRHVLAAALRAVAAVIVTSNLTDFPTDVSKQCGIEVHHSDDFITHLLDLASEPALNCVGEMIG